MKQTGSLLTVRIKHRRLYYIVCGQFFSLVVFCSEQQPIMRINLNVDSTKDDVLFYKEKKSAMKSCNLIIIGF